MRDPDPYRSLLASSPRMSPLRSPRRVLAAMRELWERTSLPIGQIAAQLGVSAATVSRWHRREGWTRSGRGRAADLLGPSPALTDSAPVPVPAVPPPQNPRFRRGRGRRYVPDVVERIRVLVEGTALTQAAIAIKAGVSPSTVWRLARRHGWTRPREAESWKALVATERAGLGPALRAGFERLAVQVERETARLRDEERGLSATIAATDRLGTAARRGAFLHGRDLDSAPRLDLTIAGPVRLIRPILRRQPGRKGAALPPTVVATARELFEESTEPQAAIARRIGVSRPTLTRWAQEGGWIRALGAPVPFGEARSSRERRIERREARFEARYRLREAERLLAELEGEERAETGRIADALRALDGVGQALRRKPLVLG